MRSDVALMALVYLVMSMSYGPGAHVPRGAFPVVARRARRGPSPVVALRPSLPIAHCGPSFVVVHRLFWFISRSPKVSCE